MYKLLGARSHFIRSYLYPAQLQTNMSNYLYLNIIAKVDRDSGGREWKETGGRGTVRV